VPVIVPVSKLPALCAEAFHADGIRRIASTAIHAQLRPENLPLPSIEIRLNRFDILASPKISHALPLLTEQNFACSVYSGKDYYWFLIDVKRNLQLSFLDWTDRKLLPVQCGNDAVVSPHLLRFMRHK
jgi:hypothetical protein